MIIENLLKIITSVLIWMAIGQTAILVAIYFVLRRLLITTRKQNDNDSNGKHNTINNRIEERS